MLTKIVPLAAAILISGAVNATSDDFNSAYQQYLDAVESGSNVEEFAKQAYQLGSKKFGASSESTANLAINYANVLKVSSEEEMIAKKSLYKLAIANLQQVYGEDDISIIDPLLGVADSTNNFSEAKDATERAIQIAKKQGEQQLAAEVYLSSAEILLKQFNNKKRNTIEEYLLAAEDYFGQNQVENSINNVKVNMYLGVYESRFGDTSNAISRLNQVVKVFDDNLEFDHPIELKAHSLLVNLYEGQGLSDEATKHCVAIAKMRPWTQDIEQQPLYQVHPKVSIDIAKNGRDSAVTVELTIDKSGFVSDTEVIAAKGDRGFERATVEAVKKWRYAPKFENGEAVVAKTQVQMELNIK
ncbi:TonB family protein [Pseudoalteromonas sp. YIC-656]|uniref:energy transducer TonB n=1 Tax=Pseudoalteromonas pernae TaxID=3118054 RepID=UPI003241DAAD